MKKFKRIKVTYHRTGTRPVVSNISSSETVDFLCDNKIHCDTFLLFFYDG